MVRVLMEMSLIFEKLYYYQHSVLLVEYTIDSIKEDLEAETGLFWNTDDASFLSFLISFLYSRIFINLNFPNMVFTLQKIF